MLLVRTRQEQQLWSLRHDKPPSPRTHPPAAFRRCLPSLASTPPALSSLSTDHLRSLVDQVSGTQRWTRRLARGTHHKKQHGNMNGGPSEGHSGASKTSSEGAWGAGIRDSEGSFLG